LTFLFDDYERIFPALRAKRRTEPAAAADLAAWRKSRWCPLSPTESMAEPDCKDTGGRSRGLLVRDEANKQAHTKKYFKRSEMSGRRGLDAGRKRSEAVRSG
jgi:hypothetical protein